MTQFFGAYVVCHFSLSLSLSLSLSVSLSLWYLVYYQHGIRASQFSSCGAMRRVVWITLVQGTCLLYWSQPFKILKVLVWLNYIQYIDLILVLYREALCTKTITVSFLLINFVCDSSILVADKKVSGAGQTYPYHYVCLLL